MLQRLETAYSAIELLALLEVAHRPRERLLGDAAQGRGNDRAADVEGRLDQ